MSLLPIHVFFNPITNKEVHNISSVVLNPYELRLLGLGLGFALKPYRPPLESLTRECINKFIRKLKLHLQFGSSPFCPSPFWTPNPTFIPDEPSSIMSKALLRFKASLLRLRYLDCKSRPNLSVTERKALLSLKERKDILIKPADKNLGPVCMDTTWYHGQCLTHLDNPKTYSRVTHLDTERIVSDLQLGLSNLLGSHPFDGNPNQTSWNKEELKYILFHTPSRVSIPLFYGLPKVHKNPISLRPITAAHSWVTTGLSKYLAKKLNSILPLLSTVLSDSFHLLNEIENLTLVNDNCYFATSDVNSLYPSIPIEEGINAVKDTLASANCYPPAEQDFIVRALHFTLTSMFVSFGDNIYHQVSGTAMGTNVAPPYAQIYLYQWELPILELFKDIVILYRRYIDDILLVTSVPLDLHHPLVLGLSNRNPNIKLSWEFSKDSIPFLDMVIYKGQRFYNHHILDVKVYQKSMNRYLYLTPRSYTPNLFSFIRGELIRYVRLSSSLEEYMKVKDLFYYRLIARGFFPHLLKAIFKDVTHSNRGYFLQLQKKDNPTQPLLPLVLPYSPWYSKERIKPLIKEHLNNYFNDVRITPAYLRSRCLLQEKGL